MSTHRLLLSVGLGLLLVTGFVVYRDLTRARQQHSEKNALSLGNVPLDGIPAEPSPYLEDHLPAGAPEHAHLVVSESAIPDPDVDLIGAADSDVDPTSGEAPPELPKLDEVDPVPLLTPDRRKQNIAAIKEALPGITDERLEFWLEETRDLPPEMIKDMLLLRKHFGALTESFNEDQLPKQKPALVAMPDPTRETLLKARGLVLQNMMNEHSIGYLATQLVFAEAPGGVQLAESYLSLKPGNHLQSDRPLDISFRSNRTFLLVYDEGERRLTRYGRLMIGPARQLQLSIEGTRLIAAPQITIPEGVTEVGISASGEVLIPAEKPVEEGQDWQSIGSLELKTVPEPAYLKPVGAACYVPTRRSGEITDLPQAADTDSLFPGTLQQSNVVYTDEQRVLERIDRWLKLRGGQTAVKPARIPAIESSKTGSGFTLDYF